MRDRQGLAGQAEDHLLVGDEAGQPQAVHGDIALLPASCARQRLPLRLLVAEGLAAPLRRQPPRRGQRRARRRVELGGVVHLDDLGRIEQGRRDLGEMHHQDRADGEVGRHDAAHAFRLAGGLDPVHAVGRNACGADYGRGSRGDRRERVVHRLRRPREIDEGARPLLVKEGGQVVALAQPADVFDAGLVLKGGDEDRADPAAVSRHRDPDRLGHCFLVSVSGRVRRRRCGRHDRARPRRCTRRSREAPGARPARRP